MQRLSFFKVKEVYQNDKMVYRALLSTNSDILRVEIHSDVSPEKAQESTARQIMSVKAVFANAVSPYPSAISNELECENKFKPTYTTFENNGLVMTNIVTYYNDRLVMGGCTQDQAVNRGILTLFYCPKRQKLYQLELIAPTQLFNQSEQKYEDMTHSIVCI